jgi:hypothetical protein
MLSGWEEGRKAGRMDLYMEGKKSELTSLVSRLVTSSRDASVGKL